MPYAPTKMGATGIQYNTIQTTGKEVYAFERNIHNSKKQRFFLFCFRPIKMEER
jgi:hypothetical protein